MQTSNRLFTLRIGEALRELRQFVEVANRQSISRAAKSLNISQPALSRAIRQLEDSYGAPLFTRTGNGVVLSPAGSALYSRAVRILPALDEAREEIEHLQGRAKASLRLATGDLWGLVILPEVINDFVQAHPDVVVHTTITDDGTRFEGLRNGIYDIVFAQIPGGAASRIRADDAAGDLCLLRRAPSARRHRARSRNAAGAALDQSRL